MTRTPRLLALALIAGLGVTAPAPISPASAAPTSPHVTRYEAVFKGDLTWRHRAEYGGPDHTADRADVSITSRLGAVRFIGTRLIGSTGRGDVVVRGEGRRSTVTGNGGHLEVCEGDSVVPAQKLPPYLQSVAGTPTLYAFTPGLTLTETCTATSGSEPYTSRFWLPAVPVPVVIPAGAVGAGKILAVVDRTVPRASCPGLETDTVGCTYRLRGTLELRLVPDVEAFEAPTRAVVGPGATSASIQARCATACTATFVMRPFKGPGRAVVTKRLAPRAASTLRLRPPTALRQQVRRSGGARLVVTYREGSASRTFTRRVRL